MTSNLKALKKLSVRGAAWMFGAHGTGELIRLGSNLILTRLLIPEDFGLMLMVNVILLGLQLFSDVGIGPSIIQNPRGTDPRFLNTAWTIQVIRGCILWLISVLLAHPFAVLYDMPQLAQLIPVAALTSIIGGFGSTKLFSLNRELHFGRIVLLGLGVSLISVTTMIIWAYFSPSVWALVVGGIVGGILHTVASHFITPGRSNRFAWDHEAAKELFSFGKWIVLSTAVGFFANRGDRLILGKFMSTAELGMFSIALVLANSLIKLVGTIGNHLLFPLYARLAEEDPAHLGKQITRARSALMAMTIPPLCALTVWGSDIVTFMWDSRYEDSGWMLQILSAGGIVQIINITLIPILLAMGDSYRHLLATISSGMSLVIAIGLGIAIDGTTGGIIGVAIAPILNYPVVVLLVRQYKIFMPLLDLAAVLGSVLLVSLGFYFT